MKNTFILFGLGLILVFPIITPAQTSMTIINYAPTVPLGNTADYIGVMTGRSVNFEFIRIMDESRFGYGIEVGRSNFFEQVPDRVYESGTITVSGTQFRYINSTPVILTAHYFFTDNTRLRPFASLGMGMVFLTQRVDMGIFSDRITSTQLAFRPELGGIFKISDYVGIKLSGKYYQTVGGSSLPSQAALGINLGFVILN